MRKTIFLSLSLILVLCSCGSLDSLFDGPEVALHSAPAFVGIDDNNAVKFLAKLDVTNHGSIAIPETDIKWKLFIFDLDSSAPFTEGVLHKNDSIGSGKTVTMEVPVSIDLMKLFEHAESIIIKAMAGEKIPYAIKLDIDFPILPFVSTITHEVKGEIPLRSPFY